MEMSSLEKFKKRNEKNFADQMSRKTHFSEAEIERLVEIHKKALVQYRSFLSYNI